MAQQIINIGTQANDGTGDSIRDAFSKTNQNFTELYSVGGGGSGATKFVELTDAPSCLTNNSLLVGSACNTVTQKVLVAGTGVNIAYSIDNITVWNSASKLCTDTSPTLCANLAGNGYRATGFASPTSNADLTTKLYVDTCASTKLSCSGGNMTGALILNGEPAAGSCCNTAINKQYVDKVKQIASLSDVCFNSIADGDILMAGDAISACNTASTKPIWLAPTRCIINAVNSSSSDISITRTGNTALFSIKAGCIDNADINASAAIAQSKLSMNAATTRANATGITQADRGLASFDCNLFNATSGWVSIKPATSCCRVLVTNSSGNVEWTQYSTVTGASAAQADTLKVNQSASYYTATTFSVAQTIVARDNNCDIRARYFCGTATSAQYADLAEVYIADFPYDPCTVLEFGGICEVTIAQYKTKALAGVVSTAPAFLMNSVLQEKENAVNLALQGRVPCKVRGPIRKGDMLVSAGNGYAEADHDPKIGTVIGKSLEDFDGDEGVIEVVVGRL